MPKRDPVAERLERLEAIRDDPESTSSRKLLKSALTAKTALVVSHAAQLAADLGIEDVAPLMREAFDRFMVDPVKTDKMCRAKESLVKALDRLGCDDDDRFIRGVRHVQLEPSWGDPVDTAAGLRGASAVAMVNARDPRAMDELARLLADPEGVARQHAAAALGAVGRMEAQALLRFKAFIGDERPEVRTDVLCSVLSMEREAGIEFVGEFLDSKDAMNREAAAVALGSSRLLQALPTLRRWSLDELRNREERRVGLVAVAMLRHPEAVDTLLELLNDDDPDLVDQVQEALQIFRHDETIMARVQARLGSSRSSSG